MGHKYVKEDETFNASRNGTVPKPTDQDVTDNKLLRADGTWQSGGGGGSTVSVDQVVTSGTEIGGITIDGVRTAFYAPILSYSTTEKVVGTWTNGKPVYQKTYDLGSDVAVSYSSWTELSAATWSGMELILRVDATTSSGTYASGISVGRKGNGKLEAQTGRNGNNQSVRYLTLLYTKSTD